jgi:hypothetical protein
VEKSGFEESRCDIVAENYMPAGVGARKVGAREEEEQEREKKEAGQLPPDEEPGESLPSRLTFVFIRNQGRIIVR